MATKKAKLGVYLSISLLIVGCVLACSSIISNDYLKLVVVMATLCAGLYGVMKSLSAPADTNK
jgi:predicted membrane channel-forming protein YqfA (hemolysin III family)